VIFFLRHESTDSAGTLRDNGKYREKPIPHRPSLLYLTQVNPNNTNSCTRGSDLYRARV